MNSKRILVDVVSNGQIACILTTHPEDLKIYGNSIVYPIPAFLSTLIRSAADELAQNYW